LFIAPVALSSRFVLSANWLFEDILGSRQLVNLVNQLTLLVRFDYFSLPQSLSDDYTFALPR
jgi:hypothetical protein